MEKRRIVVIQGCLAAGKSVFARRLGQVSGVPCLTKDGFKAALCGHTSLADRAESSRFSAAAFDGMMYTAEQLMAAGWPVILEGNFVPAGVKAVDEAGTIRALVRQYGYLPLTFRFSGDTRVLYRRFLDREAGGEREEANRLGFVPDYAVFEGWCRGLDGFAIGGAVLFADTTDFAAAGLEDLLQAGRRFLGEGSPPGTDTHFIRKSDD